MDDLLTPLVTLFVTIDPVGLAPLFLGVTRGMTTAQRRSVGARACLIAAPILVGFALAGAAVLTLFGITLPAFRIAGGLLLFWIAFEMIFERRNDRKEKTVERAEHELQSVAIFPLAIPLIAGPGAISAVILLNGAAESYAEQGLLLVGVLAILLLTWIVFLVAERIDLVLGETGRAVLTRLLGVILAALAVQFVADGILNFVVAGTA